TRQPNAYIIDIDARIFEGRSASTNPRRGDNVLAQGVILVRFSPISHTIFVGALFSMHAPRASSCNRFRIRPTQREISTKARGEYSIEVKQKCTSAVAMASSLRTHQY